MQSLPDTGLLPVPTPSPARRPATTAELAREEPPGAAGAQDEDDAGEGSAIRNPRTAALRLGWFLGQQGFDSFPQVVRDKRLTHSEERVSCLLARF